MDDFNQTAENPSYGGKKPDEPSSAPAIKNVDMGDENDVALAKKAKMMKACKLCMICGQITFFLICTVALIFIIHRSPYEPGFWMFAFSMIIFWLLSFALVAMHYVQSRRDADDTSAPPSSPGVVTYVLFGVLAITMICSLAMMLLAVKVICPDCFNPTTGMVLEQIRGVTADSARFMIRDPTVAGLVTVEYRLNGTTDAFSSVSATSASLLAENDYVAHIEVTGLTAATAYEWRFADGGDDARESRSFKTNPATGDASKFTFYFGSCFLNGFPNFQEAPGFGYVEKLNPDLFFFLGDFIYSDIPYFKNDEVDTYHTLYRNSMRNPGVQSVFANTPNYHMWDDHEIKNDYPDIRATNLYQSGGSFENAIEKGWTTFLGNGNPDATATAGKTYFSFEYGDSTFALVDTRGYRDSRLDEDNAAKSLLGDEQKQWIYDWLLANNETSTFKFLFSPVGFTLDFPDDDESDSWAGYSTERQEILDFIRDNRIQGVVCLSGDSHMMYATKLQGVPSSPDNATGIYEFSASPISAFDNTFGGFRTLVGLAGEAFKAEEDRDGELMYWTKGAEGAISLIGLMRVDTTLADPTVTVELYESEELRFTKTLTSTQLRLW